MMGSLGGRMRKADLTTRAVAGFIDFLLVLGLSRLPDIIGFLAATGYLLIRDGLFNGRSAGKKLVGLHVADAEAPERTAGFRDSIIRNATLALCFVLFLLPYAGWVLGPLALAAECLTAIGDERGMRVGDLLAGTWTVQDGPEAEVTGTDEAQPPAQDQNDEGGRGEA